MADETVHLDTLDGFSFEGLCARIFDKAGWGKVTRMGGVADRGRDLIIDTEDGKKIIVECKFYNEVTTVGRPTVQKLHSAIIDSDADSGIIITTGRFSKSAIGYAKDLEDRAHPIELYDMFKILELAHKAGIELVGDDDTGRIYSYPLLDTQEVPNVIHGKFGADIISYPNPVSNMTRDIRIRTVVDPHYMVVVSIQQTFRTTVGVISHLDVNNDEHMFDGQTGKMGSVDMAGFFGQPTMTGAPPAHTTDDDFGIDRTQLKEHILDELQDWYTRSFSYTGRNNSTYTKECVPSPRNIQIHSIRQAYVSWYEISLKVLDTAYHCAIYYNGESAMITWTGNMECNFCYSDHDLILCNECGRIAHTSKSDSHGFRCHQCKKTICHGCVWVARRLLVLKRRFCSDCRPKKAKRNPKLPERQMQYV